MKSCKLIVQDQVNVRFEGLEADCRRKISESLKVLVPYARHMPQFKLGRWDGKISFATVGGASYFNLLERILPIVAEFDYGIEIDDRRTHADISFPTIDENYVAHIMWPEGHSMAGEPIILRDYQVGAINDYFANPQSMQCISTGAGKTLTCACLSLACEPLGRTLVIVPSKSLVEQTEEDYKNIGLDVGVYFGDRKEWGHTHTIATWQSLGAFCKRKDDYANMDESFASFIKDVSCVIVDEAHSVRGSILKDLLTGPLAHCPIRWAMTGTIPKDEHEFLPLFISIGPVVGEIRAKTLQDKGVLAQLDIEILQLNDQVQYPSFESEYEYLTTDIKRVKWIAEFCRSLEGNSLVLVDRIECGQMLQSLIPDSVFISGNVKSKDRRAEYKAVTDATSKVIIATSGVAAVGINVPAIHNLVMVAATKSFVRTIQSIGRILRKTKEKDSAKVYDITSVCKFAARHLAERKKFYREAEYPFTIKKVDF